MAYYQNNNYGGGNRYPPDRRGAPPDGRRGEPRPFPQEAKTQGPLPLPKNYVDKAEEVMLGLKQDRSRLTTSKIRNLYSLVSDIYNSENLRDEPELLPESVTGLNMARIRMVYEAGREQSVKDFLEKARLLAYLKDIGTDRNKLIDFAHYMEALVAYHRFYIGGREG